MKREFKIPLRPALLILFIVFIVGVLLGAFTRADAAEEAEIQRRMAAFLLENLREDTPQARIDAHDALAHEIDYEIKEAARVAAYKKHVAEISPAQLRAEELPAARKWLLRALIEAQRHAADPKAPYVVMGISHDYLAARHVITKHTFTTVELIDKLLAEWPGEKPSAATLRHMEAAVRAAKFPENTKQEREVDIGDELGNIIKALRAP